MDPLIILFGLGVGVLIGMTGIGGGSLMTPLLILVFGTKPVVAIGTDLAYGAVTKTLGGWRHLRKGTVDFGLAAWMALGSCPGAILGVLAIEWIERTYGDAFENTMLVSLGIALFLVGGSVLFRALFLQRLIAQERDEVPMTARNKVAATTIGLVLGTILGLTSVGSGALIGLALILVFKLTPQRVVGTDVFHAAGLLWVAALTHLFFGNVDYGLMANILIGSLPGVWLGTNLMAHIPTAGLRIGLGVVLFASAFGILQKAGAGYGLAVTIGVPIALGLTSWVIYRARTARIAAAAVPAPETPVPASETPRSPIVSETPAP
ncbi:MAG TPA: sulfite exporter TauE/SafE family protein [Capillimicrobium sp.]|nr:sulfite exporter TauE/SafE family protein [Capillimicrobium sp.]